MDPFVLLMLLFLCETASAEDPDVRSVNPGDDVILPCRSADPNIGAVEWTRTDLEPEDVLLSIDGHFRPENQHPSFQGRVQLVDSDLKDGDVSLTLKNVKSSDEGTYECRAVGGSRRQKIENTEPISRVRLQVTDVRSLRPGDDVILPCRSADPNIGAVEWTRTDLESEHVLFYRDGHLHPQKQHPFFQDRVQLVESDLKDGDVSLILKNVSSSDEGTYECRVRVDDSRRQKRSIFDDQPIRRVRLQVIDVTKSVNPGDNVILPCRSADPNIGAVEWTRPDLKSEYVLFYRDGHLHPQKQHPFFQDRVQLVDSDLKDGDVSLTLKNVSSSDEGTYECRVRVDDSRRKKRAIIKTEPIRRVRLQVSGSDHAVKKDGEKKDGEKKDGGHSNMTIGLAAAVFLVCSSLVGFFVFRKFKGHLNKERETAAAGEAERVELNV